MNINRMIRQFKDLLKYKKMGRAANSQNKRMVKGIERAQALIARCQSKGGQTLEQWILLKELEGLYIADRDKNPELFKAENFELFIEELLADDNKLNNSQAAELLLKQYKIDFGVDFIVNSDPVDPEEILMAHLGRFATQKDEFFDHEDASYTRIEQLLA
jgi:hypothetical protein